MPLAGLLPLMALALTVGLFHRGKSRVSEAIVLGSLAWSFGIALCSETLSFWHAIGQPSFLACWSLAVIALALALRWPLRAPYDRRTLFGRIHHTLAGITIEDWILAGVLALIGGATLLLAWVSTPNNWDSQTYHLARIEHWTQNRSFDFYLTAIDRQLELPSFAEMLVLQFRLLSGGDRLDNIVQWLAGAGSVVVVGRIALALGASRRGTALARLTAATLPIGILESTSTQNDLVVTFFLLCMAERLLAWRESRRMEDAGFMAIAMGLALATKGTAYLIGFPLGLWFLAEILPAGRRSAWPLLVCGLLLLLPNLPGYMRNLAYSGSPVGTIGRVSNNAEFGLGPLVVNGARNLAVNLASSDKGLNQRITDIVYRGLGALGLDANAPDLSFPPAPEKFRLLPYQTSEDFAGNPVQLLIGVASVLVVLITRGKQPYPRRRYALAIVAGTLVFLVVLRWQPWITRLQLPIFALSAPLAAFLPIDSQGRPSARILPTALAAALAFLLVYSAWPALWRNSIRPLVFIPGAGSIWNKSAEGILFTSRPDLRLQYQAAVDYALQHGDSQIGLVMSVDDWEYPLWRDLRHGGIADLRIEHIGVPNPHMPKPYPLGPFNPTLVIATTKSRPAEMTIDGNLWHRHLQLPSLAVYTRDP
jgi:4-amino-4-deoxy-L-arabinose transferase-like glycosyltransferase